MTIIERVTELSLTAMQTGRADVAPLVTEALNAHDAGDTTGADRAIKRAWTLLDTEALEPTGELTIPTEASC